MIKITDWIAAIPPEDKHIAYVGENESVTRQFLLPDSDYRDYAFYLDLAFDLSTVTSQTTPKQIVSTQQSMNETATDEGMKVSSTESLRKESYTESGTVVDCTSKTDVAPLAKLMHEDGLLLTWTVLSQQTQLPGPLRATLRAVGPNGEVKKSAMMVFIVAPSVAAAPAASVPLTEHEQMERAMVEAFEHAAQQKMDDMIADAKEWADNVNGVYIGSGEMPAGAVIQIDPTGEAITAKDWIRSEGQALLDMVYPVGSIYLSVNAADPSTLFGGTWERLKDRFLLGAGDSYAAGATGGAAKHTLTASELPSHNHQITPIIKNASGDSMTTNGYTIVHTSDNLVAPNQTLTASTLYGGYSGNTGGGQAHNNMPPYLAVYMWKRTA